MPVVESRGAFLFSPRRLGCFGVCCLLAVVLWGCSHPFRSNTPNPGGTTAGGGASAGGLAGFGGTSVSGGQPAAGGSGGTSAPAGGTTGMLPAGGNTGAGGTSGTGGSVETGGATAPQGPFAATGNMTVARLGHTATLLPNGKILIAGGCGDNSEYLASAELYDPAVGTFTATGGMTVRRCGHTATLLPNGKVLIAGGDTLDRYLPPSAELYDPGVGTFTTAGTVDVAGLGHTATSLSNGNVLFAGGLWWAAFIDGGGVLDVFASAELYDPSAGTLTATGSMTVARYDQTATLLSSGKVLFVGGYDSASSYDVTASAELYDPSASSFTVISGATAARVGQKATLLPSGKVLIAGGSSEVLDNDFFASAELYDPAAGTFAATGSMTVARFGHSVTVLPSEKVLIAGGASNDFTTLQSAELYDPAAGTFAAIGNMTAARTGHTATLLPSGKVLIVGGWNYDNTTLASAELY